MCEKKIRERNWTWGHNCNTKCFNHTFFTNCKGKWFFNIKKCKIFHKHFLLHIILFGRDLLKQNIQIWENGNIQFFLCKLSFNIFSPLIINFFPKLKKIIGWFTSRCFYKHELCHLFCNMVLDLSLIIFLHLKKRHVENDTTNNASFEEHQGLFLSCL